MEKNCGPTLYRHGTDEAKAKYLLLGLLGDTQWRQLFSEPSGGSDFASLRTSEVRDGDEYVINGQKIWTSGAHRCFGGFIIVRTLIRSLCSISVVNGQPSPSSPSRFVTGTRTLSKNTSLNSFL